MADRASDLEIAERYDAGCEAYDELYAMEQEEKYEVVLKVLRPRGRVIDVGCGSGLLIEYMRSRGLLDAVDLYVCVDVSSCMLGLATKRAASCGAKCVLVQANAYNLPFRDGSFDVAYSISVVNLLERPADAMAEITRVSGRAVVTAPIKLGDLGAPPGWARIGLAGKDVVYAWPHDQSVQR